ncbi:MAG: hypothetical protein HKN05_17560, partial [Rhizobiales bacterium]|nr:hypothetical protein [Hyphomicrobiales bacterium]
ANDDRLQVSDANFLMVDGGSGQDTLVLDETDLDFTTVNLARFASIEAIDLKEGGPVSIKLGLASIAALSETGNDDLDAVLDTLLGAANAPDESLVVSGGAGDAVELAPSAEGEWYLTNTEAFADHDIYTFQTNTGSVLAAVAIDDDVNVTGANVPS